MSHVHRWRPSIIDPGWSYCAECHALVSPEEYAQLTPPPRHRRRPQFGAVLELAACAFEACDRWDADEVDDDEMSNLLVRLRRAAEAVTT